MKNIIKNLIGFNHAKSIFSYNIKKDIAIGIFILGMFAALFFINREPGNIPENLNIADVNVLDRMLMFPYIEWMDNIKYAFLILILVSPIISPLVGKIRSKCTWLTYSIMYMQAVLFTLVARGILEKYNYSL